MLGYEGDISNIDIHHYYRNEDLTKLFGDYSGTLGVYDIHQGLYGETFTLHIGDLPETNVCPEDGFADADTVQIISACLLGFAYM